MIQITIMYNVDVIVSFPYSKELVDKIKQLPVRVWNPEEKVWWFPKTYLDMFLETLNGIPYIINEVKVERKEPNIETFQYKTKPFDHQRKGLLFGKEHDRFLLGDEQGLGKTKQAIDIAEYKRLDYGYKHTFIICGVKTLTHNWLKEIETHSYNKGVILGSSKGGSKEKLKDLNRINELPYFIITNIETLRNKEILKTLKKLIDSKEIGMIVFDEFHKVKNPESQQGKALLQLKPFTRLAMTGTPLMNSPLDLYSVLNWLDIEHHNFYQFKNHYCELGKFKEVIGYKNLHELTTILEGVMLRRRKQDVLDLPPKIYTTEYVEMGEEQESIYQEVRTQIIQNIDKILLSKNPLTELIRLRQATGFTGILSESVRVSSKFDRALDLLEDVVANNGKAVIFSQWTNVIDPLYDFLKKSGYNPAIITGDVKDRQKEQEKFLKDNTCKVLVGTIASMGTGLTLTAANTVIFLDSPWNKATKEQAEDRCHRIGTTGTVNIITLVCKDTIDESIEDVVYLKGKLSDAIVDGEIKTTNRKGLLKTLLSL